MVSSIFISILITPNKKAVQDYSRTAFKVYAIKLVLNDKFA